MILKSKPPVIRLIDIPRPVVRRTDSPQTKLLLRAAPRCLQYLLEHSIIFINRQGWPERSATTITLLSGGINAAAYLVQHRDWSVVVKFDYRSMRAEAEALAAWRQRGASVVSLLNTGEIPLKIGSRYPVRYVILEGVMTPAGEPAPAAITYITEQPRLAPSFGEAVGRQLALMHSATTKRRFGEYADMEGTNTKPYGTFNTYLAHYLEWYKALFIDELGYSAKRYQQLIRQVRRTRFPRTGRYIHGDPSPRNILMASQRPLSITIIDPNPIVGHPTWDLAIITNNAELTRRKSQLRPDNRQYRLEARWRAGYAEGVITGYHAQTKRRIHSRHLRLVRLVHGLMLTSIAVATAQNAAHGLAEDVDVRAHREMLADLMAATLGEPATHSASSSTK